MLVTGPLALAMCFNDRFESFPVQSGEHFLAVWRDVDVQ